MAFRFDQIFGARNCSGRAEKCEFSHKGAILDATTHGNKEPGSQGARENGDAILLKSGGKEAANEA